MKKSTKRLFLGLGLALLSGNAVAQNGIEQIVVEKYYIANAADAAASMGTLPVGSVTYRVYVDMLPGYKFQALYGDANHPLKFSTTTSFFNNEDRGATTANAIASAQLKNNTVALDSWFSVGASATGQFGVLKSDDNGAANLLSTTNPTTVLKNTAAALGIPLTTHDGNMAGSPEAVTFVGFDPTGGVFDATSQAGNQFLTTDGAISALSGATGPTSSNRILIGQFTTDGVFRFELNIQVGTPTPGVSQKFVAKNPGAGEISIPTLILEPNVPPTISITNPTNNQQIVTGTNVNITANATDSDGTVSKVNFYVDGNKVGESSASPYTFPYTATVGNHAITATAIDDKGDSTTTAAVNIVVANNQAPTISVVSSANNAIVGDVLTFTATANDVDGSVASVEFFVNNVSIGSDNTAPFSQTWTSTTGAHVIKAVATDNLGLTGTSSNINVSIANNNPPTAAITAPLANATIIAPTVVNIEATATDSDGSVSQVEFLVNGVVVGTDNASPYAFAWTSTPGAKTITVRSTDNKGATTTSAALNLNIADPNALPYEVRTIDQKCILPTFSVPVAASATNNVDNVIGYDLVLNYDKNKLTPTGNIVVNGDMINATLVNTSNAIDAANGKMNISVYFTPQAPAGTKFAGNGKLISVEFNKTANFASVDTAIISVSSLQESYISGVQTKAVSAGKAITHKDYIYPMALRFWGDNKAIKYDASLPNNHLITNVYGADVATKVLNPNNVAAVANVDGVVNYDLRNGLAVSIKRDIAGTTDVFDVVNAADVSVVNSILLNDVNVTPSVYQVIAADVNLDGVISAGDISQIRQRGTLKIAEFRQAWNYDNAGVSNGQPSRDWIFVDSMRLQNDAAYKISTSYPSNDLAGGFSKSRVPVVPAVLNARVSDYANCPVITGETYKGIMLGDVDGTYAAQPNSGLLKSNVADQNAKIVFDLTKAKKSGNVVEVPVSIESDEKFNAFDFALNLSDEAVKLEGITVASKEIENFYHYNEEDQTLRFTSNNYDNFATYNTVATIKLRVDENASLNTLKPRLAMLNGRKTQVEVRQTQLEATSFDLKLFPNPASENVSVRTNEDAVLVISDLTGKQVSDSFELKANTTKNVNLNELPQGVYLFKVTGENVVRVERVVINK